LQQLNPQLEQWLQQLSLFKGFGLSPLAGDASFRRYYRLIPTLTQEQSYIAMDASLEVSSCQAFVAIAEGLAAQGVNTPKIFAADLQQGFILLSDFGNRLYLNELSTENAATLYRRALDALLEIQSCRQLANWTLPLFDEHFLQSELNEFQNWVLTRYLALTPSPAEKSMLCETFEFLIKSATEQPQVFMHRDYHSANLMVLPNQQVGVLDFQDACLGPITYDVVSLLRDCYIDWPEAEVQALLAYYQQQLAEVGVKLALSDFQQWFDLMGVQRHLKAAFIFARKYLRDQTPRYLQYLPRTFNYVAKVSAQYPQLANLHEYLNETLQPLLQQRGEACLVG